MLITAGETFGAEVTEDSPDGYHTPALVAFSIVADLEVVEARVAPAAEGHPPRGVVRTT